MIINYITFIIVIHIIIILIKKINNNIFLKQNAKKNLAYYPKIILVGTGFEPGTFEFFNYLRIYLTRSNNHGFPTTCVFLCF